MIVGAELSLPFVYALVIGGVIFAAWAWRGKTRAIYRASVQQPPGPYDWRVSCPELRQPTHVHRRARSAT